MASSNLLVLISLVSVASGATNLFWPYDVHAGHMFESSDFNMDGVLDLLEMNESFRGYDLNNDKRIHRQEYIHFVTYYNPDLYAFAGAVFTDYDRHLEDGYLDPDDLSMYLNHLDSDGNGQVVRTEFVNHWVQLFTEFEHLHIIPASPAPPS